MINSIQTSTWAAGKMPKMKSCTVKFKLVAVELAERKSKEAGFDTASQLISTNCML